MLLVWSTIASANHLLGGNITYQCLGGSEYTFTLELYSDCFGSTNPIPQLDIFINSSCGVPFSIPVDLISTEEVSDVCSSEILSTSCNNGFGPGTLLLTYTSSTASPVVLSDPCTYEIAFSNGDWSGFMTNVDNATLPEVYFQTIVDPTQGCHTSPIITSLQTPYACLGEELVETLTFDNPNNYDIVVSIAPLLTDNAAIAPGYNPLEPIPGINVTPQGEISFTANDLGNNGLGLLIEYFDGGGNLLGSILESMSVVVRLCDTNPTEFVLPEIASVSDNAIQTGDNAVTVCLGDTLSFIVEARNANVFRSIAITSDLASELPTATLTTTPVIDPDDAILQAEFTYVADVADAGLNTITFTSSDDNCESDFEDQITIEIFVELGIDPAFTDSLICFGESIVLQVDGDTEYNWQVLSGDFDPDFSCLTCGNPSVSPGEDTQIRVEMVNSNATCAAVDTIFVDVALSGLAAVVTDENCLGNNGSIDVTTNGGSGAYTFLWNTSPPSFDEDVVGLIAGTYSFNVADPAVPGCNRDSTFVVLGPGAPSVSMEVDSATVCAEELLEVELSFIGTAPWNFTYEDGLGNANSVVVASSPFLWSIPTSASDVFCITDISDADPTLCDAFPTDLCFTTTVVDNPTFSFVVEENICLGDSAELAFDIGGVGPFTATYTTNGFNPTTIGVSDIVPSFLTLANDSEICFTEISTTLFPGCQTDLDLCETIAVFDSPIPAINAPAALCAGECTSLGLTISGTAPYTIDYELVNVATQQVTAFTATFAADVGVLDPNFCPTENTLLRIVEVSDATPGACINTLVYEQLIEVDSISSISMTGSATICASDSILLTLEVSAAGPFSFDLNGNSFGPFAPGDLNDDGELVLSYASQTSETIVLTNFVDQQNTCSAILNDTFELTVLSLPAVDAGPDLLLCSGSEATIGSPEEMGVDYSWTESLMLESLDNSQTTFFADNSTEADVNIWLTLEGDNGTCSAADSVLVTVFPLPVIEAGEDAFLCFGDTYTASATLASNYLWSGGCFVGAMNTATPELCPEENTTYYVETTDSNGCLASDSVFVTVSEDLVLASEYTPEICEGTCDGQIAISPQGGIAPYTYIWSDNVGQDTLATNLCPTEGSAIFATITDSLGCSIVGQWQIEEMSLYTFQEVSSTQVGCFGENNGSIEASALDAVAYTLSFEGQSFEQESGLFVDLFAGIYTVSATNDIGCTADIDLEIGQNAPIVINAPSLSQIVCLGEEVTFQVTPEGGSGDFSFSWLSNGVLLGEGPSLSIPVFDSFSVSFFAQDSAGCISDTLEFAAAVAADFEAFIVSPEEVSFCAGDSINLLAYAEGGTGNFSYAWNILGSDQLLGTSDQLMVTPATNITYVLSLDDGCSALQTDSLTLPVHPIPEVDFTFQTQGNCYPIVVDFFSSTNAEETLHYSWDFGNEQTADEGPNVTFTFVEPGIFNPSLTVTSIETGCSNSTSSTVPVEVHGYPDTFFSTFPPNFDILTEEVSLDNLTEDAVAYDWTLNDAFFSSDFEPDLLLNAEAGDSLILCLNAVSEVGCEDSFCREYEVENVALLFIPSAFTPDKDGFNEVFQYSISGVEEDGFSFSIYSRNGELIFFSNTPGEVWTGEVRNGLHYAKDDVYNYLLKAIESGTGESIVKRGSITILR